MTSNPSIFEKAIAESHLYDSAVQALAREGRSPQAIYETLSRQDVQSAADAFNLTYAETKAGDGYVSLEVDPHLARDTQGTVDEARRLWISLARPNVLIKVPATDQGLPAIRQLIQEGINVNVTLIFGMNRYLQVAEAYLAGLEARAAQGLPLSHVASVASFFISRVDAMVDPMLLTAEASLAGEAKAVRGMVAIASAKAAYHHYLELSASYRFRTLASAGALPQRLLWASTSTKDPRDSDVKYMEGLIGRDTINTAPPQTLDAYLDHGRPEARLEAGLGDAQALLASLSAWGIDLRKVERRLEDEGVEKFIQPFDRLMVALAERSASVANGRPGRVAEA
jgi:transaldolase/transaldolase/glucose-6-phosphate isomerase